MSKQKQFVTALRTSEDFLAYETLPIEKWEPQFGERLITHAFLMDVLRKVMGRVLTVIDASVVGQQNKAMKDIVREIISNEMEFAADMCFDQKQLQEQVSLNMKEIEPVTIEDALGVKQ